MASPEPDSSKTGERPVPAGKYDAHQKLAQKEKTLRLVRA